MGEMIVIDYPPVVSTFIMTIGTKATFARWATNVVKWRAKYGVETRSHIDRVTPYDPSKVSLRQCKKCDSTWHLTRHHKGNEYLFATINEEKYAARYVQFHPDDVVVLCERCHEKIHNLYKPILAELHCYLSSVSTPAIPWLEEFRYRFIRRCNQWLKKKMKKPSTKVKSRYSK